MFIAHLLISLGFRPKDQLIRVVICKIDIVGITFFLFYRSGTICMTSDNQRDFLPPFLPVITKEWPKNIYLTLSDIVSRPCNWQDTAVDEEMEPDMDAGEMSEDGEEVGWLLVNPYRIWGKVLLNCISGGGGEV